VAMLHTVRSMLADSDFVHVFSFDFSKAFDTVRHATLAGKLAELQLPDSVYNWAVDFLDNHAHCTKYAGIVSAVATIQASVVQGSALGPACYVVTAADLHPVHDQNRIFKFADDTYLVVPGVKTGTCLEEIRHLQAWATDNNLKLNSGKTKEIIFTSRHKGVPPPPPCPGIERVTSLRVLGVIVNDKLTAADHVTSLLSSGSSLLYAMRVLRSHGTPPASLHDVFRATVVSRIQYAAPAWSGMCSAADRARLDSLLRRAKRLGYCNEDVPSVADLFSTADEEFFSRLKSNSEHVLQPYLPGHTEIPYQLRTRHHNMTLINKTKYLNDTDYVIRMLYKYAY
jgi:Reverse transcriptase (RNA-dependent DNA polymerase)